MKVSDERLQLKYLFNLKIPFYNIFSFFAFTEGDFVEVWLLWWIMAIQRYLKSYVTWDKEPNYTALKYDKADFFVLQ